MARVIAALLVLGGLTVAGPSHAGDPNEDDRLTFGFAGDTDQFAPFQITSNGKWLIYGHHAPRVLDATTLEERFRLLDASRPPAVAVDPRSDRILYAAEILDDAQHLEPFLVSLDPTTGRRTKLPGSWKHRVTALELTADGRFLAVGDADGTVTVLQMKTGKPVLKLPPHTSEIWDVEFSKDGKEIATRSSRTVRRYGFPEGDFHANEWLRDGPLLPSLYDPSGRSIEMNEGASVLTVHERGKDAFTIEPGRGPQFRTSIAFDPSGAKLFTATSGDVQRWDLATKKRELAFPLDATHVLPDPRGAKLFTLADDRIASWEIPTLEGPAPCAVDVSPDGRRIAAGSADGTLTLHDAAGKVTARAAADKNALCTLRYSTDGRTLVSSLEKESTSLFDATTGARVATFPAVEASSPRANTVALLRSANVDIVDLDRRAITRSFKVLGSASQPALSHDGKSLLLVVGPMNAHISGAPHVTAIHVLDAALGQTKRTIVTPTDLGPVHWASDGTIVALTGGAITRWNADTGALISRTVVPGREPTLDPSGDYATYRTLDWLHLWELGKKADRMTLRDQRDAVVASDGKSVITTAREGPTRRISFTDPPGRLPIDLGARGKFAIKKERATDIVAASFSPDGQRLVFSGPRLGVKSLALDTGVLTSLPYGSGGESIAFSPDGKSLALATSRSAATIHDPASLASVLRFDMPNAPAGDARVVWPERAFADAIGFGRNGTSLVFAAFERTMEWDRASGKVLTQLPESADAVSPDGEWLAFAKIVEPKLTLPPDPAHGRERNHIEVRLRSLKTGKTRTLVTDIEGYDNIIPVVFSPDSRMIAVARSWQAEVWDVGSGVRRAKLEHTCLNSANGLAISPDGTRLLASCSFGGQVTEIATGHPIGELHMATTALYHDVRQTAAFHPDGMLAAIADNEGIVLWRTDKQATALHVEVLANLDALVVHPYGDLHRVEVIGPDAAAAKKRLVCFDGLRALPFDQCGAIEGRDLIAELRVP